MKGREGGREGEGEDDGKQTVYAELMKGNRKARLTAGRGRWEGGGE